MIIKFTHGYPHPVEYATQEQHEKLAQEALGNQFIIRGVHSIEMLHTTTVQFVSQAMFQHAVAQTGWKVWDFGRLILEAPTCPEGYDYPAHVIKSMAYCGMQLGSDVNPNTGEIS